MANLFLARGETTTWFHVWRVIVALGAIAGAVIYFAGDPLVGEFVFIPFFVLTVWLEIWASITRARRLWIAVQDDGFTAKDARGERTYRDAQVAAMAYTSKNTYREGVLSGFSRTCKLWMANENAPLIFDNTFKLNQADPLGAFITRIANLLTAGFTRGLDQGLALEGDGWRLTNQDLSFRKGGRTETLRIDDITAVEDHDGKMGVWRGGEDLPVAQFPVDGRNVWLLRNVVNPIIKKRTAEAPPPSGLGRVLFQRGAKKFLTIFMVVLALGFVLGSVALFMDKRSEVVAGFVLGVFGLLFTWAALACIKTNFRCHEWGVYKAGLFGSRQLMYKDVKAFTYSAIRQYYKGSYIGTALKFYFEPISVAEHGKGFGFNTSVSGGDAALDGLRDFVAKVIAARMKKELAAGAKVQWTPNIAFLPEGFELRPAGFFARKDPVFLPYTNYGNSNLNLGQFAIFEKGNAKPIIKESAAAANFYPGWFVLQEMFHKA